MSQSLRWTSKDLELFPQPLDDTRYEIIDGELFVSTQPSWEHQFICAEIVAALHQWSRSTGAGVVNFAPGLIFSEDQNVAPDIVWVSAERLPLLLEADRKLHAAPDLVVEVLSPGPKNEQRDREVKLNLYSRRGVREYWIVDWQLRQIDIYRRSNAALELATTALDGETVRSPLLSGFELPLSDLFGRLPAA
ncbi:MAG: Uma2 family endonuclease [Chloroflexi bacterium]|nr:Uma2 family endonuclease [Chloroflexota bacterium]